MSEKQIAQYDKVVKGTQLTLGDDENVWTVTDVAPNCIVTKGRIKGASVDTRRYLYRPDFATDSVFLVVPDA